MKKYYITAIMVLICILIIATIPKWAVGDDACVHIGDTMRIEIRCLKKTLNPLKNNGLKKYYI